MNRRHFAQMSAFALAGMQVPSPSSSAAAQAGRAGGPTAPRRVGIAPVGLGSIAEVFLGAVGKTPNARITGLVTGHPADKGKRFAAQYGVPEQAVYTYESFDRIRENPEH